MSRKAKDPNNINDKFITLSLSQRMVDFLEEMHWKMRMTRSKLVRKAICEYAHKNGVKVPQGLDQ